MLNTCSYCRGTPEGELFIVLAASFEAGTTADGDGLPISIAYPIEQQYQLGRWAISS